ncbi:hypothetical protein [Bradyrhizobium sp. Ai1a-2]|uniref:hypothetical protein n=1 Tax=Bradyrhizobium sp. Ai1a-2 TaxID=196490 RepID=UPI001916E001|nr:hypothetical protein [Bradyrhizobium sp. Ai1a-2]
MSDHEEELKALRSRLEAVGALEQEWRERGRTARHHCGHVYSICASKLYVALNGGCSNGKPDSTAA